MVPFPQPRPQSPPHVSRPDSPSPASPDASLPVSLSDSILHDDKRSACFTYCSLTSHPHHRQRLRPHGQEQRQTQKQEQEQEQRQGQRCDYPSPPCTLPPDRANAYQRSELSLHHEQIQQMPSLASMQEQRALNSHQCKEEIGVSTCIPRSPDPGYLEAFHAYFALGHINQSDVAESHSEHGSHTEDEEDDRDRKHGEERNVTARERRRSRSICGLVSTETPFDFPGPTEGSALVSHANNGTVITPPPPSRCRHSPRRRHHSCVAPNTKEFRTLATIFGWVTTSPSAWTKESCGQRTEKVEAQTESPLQYYPVKHPAVFETDDDSDLDSNFPHGAMMEWGASFESRYFDINDSCLQSPIHDLRVTNNSIELLSDLDDLGLSPSSSRQDPARQHGAAVPPLSDIQYDIQQISTLGPEIMLPRLTPASANVSIAEHRYGNFMDPLAPANDSWLNTEPILEQSPFGPQPLITGTFVKTGQRHAGQRYSVQSFPPDILCMNQSIVHIQHGPSFKCTNDRAPQSPMSCSQGMDSGYMSLSYSLLSQPALTLVTGAEQHPIGSLNDQTSISLHPVRQTGHQTIGIGICTTADDKKPTSEDVTEACSAPLIPPRYPEIDARVFDRTADEGPDSIVYAPLATPNDSLSSTHELRPIIAATIVKLIEKLTHQYGMDSGFMTDFFLTYRLFMSPVQLCKYLIQRYLWALEQETESRCVVRVRWRRS
ncbi:hypothetical protein EDD21DRAFT_24583 [Dissophora ornata]|nr:hypothetical protein EDD21DRAFT_24583 [Dissophora ornata]